MIVTFLLLLAIVCGAASTLVLLAAFAIVVLRDIVSACSRRIGMSEREVRAVQRPKGGVVVLAACDGLGFKGGEQFVRDRLAVRQASQAFDVIGGV